MYDIAGCSVYESEGFAQYSAGSIDHIVVPGDYRDRVQSRALTHEFVIMYSVERIALIDASILSDDNGNTICDISVIK